MRGLRSREACLANRCDKKHLHEIFQNRTGTKVSGGVRPETATGELMPQFRKCHPDRRFRSAKQLLVPAIHFRERWLIHLYI
jgi:hypothetical protein